MTAVRMIADLSGYRDGVPWPKPGETIELPDEEAADLIRLGLAEPFDPDLDGPGD